MKIAIKKSLLLFVFLFGTLQAFAGAGHSHTVTDGTIKMNAQKHLNMLVQKKKVDESWWNAKYVDMKKQGILAKEWIVSFKNDKVTDTSKQTIYIYLTTYGKVKGANYEGK